MTGEEGDEEEYYHQSHITDTNDYYDSNID